MILVFSRVLRTFLSISGAVSVSFGCSGQKQFNRSKAQDLIRQSTSFNRKNVVTFKTGTVSGLFFSGSYRQDPESRKYAVLDHLGLILVERGGLLDTVRLTEKGTAESKGWKTLDVGGSGPSDFWQIPVAEREFVEITGVTEPLPTEATAEFTWKWIPNSMGKNFNIDSGKIYHGRAWFKLYDDGWRLVEKRLNLGEGMVMLN